MQATITRTQTHVIAVIPRRPALAETEAQRVEREAVALMEAWLESGDLDAGIQSRRLFERAMRLERLERRGSDR